MHYAVNKSQWKHWKDLKITVRCWHFKKTETSEALQYNRDSMGRNSAAKLSGNSDLPALNRRVWEWHLNGLEILSSRRIQDSLWWTRWTLLYHAPNVETKCLSGSWYTVSVYLFDSAWLFDSACYMSAKIRRDALASWQSKSSQTSVWSTFS